ncbi:hypothetical protein HMPREF0484_3842 [Klebsiella pneumoniae subsp. rhinoscleromatis ATCC 13884]|nr:hypothetical protein HMPREF0484_3842 [Klebsiella pneumoniae subsp. rhinoscleromatis ATCC 13884]
MVQEFESGSTHLYIHDWFNGCQDGVIFFIKQEDIIFYLNE